MRSIDDPLHDKEVGVADVTQDTTRIDDVRIGAVRPLISPALLQDELPVSPEVQALVERSRETIGNILHGRDDRLLAVVGPCSIHDHDQALDYAHRLKAAADALKDDLYIVMRVYFEKPRTTVGWKGYINDPRLDGSFRINEGLRCARQLLLDINGLGLPAGTEFLDLLSPQYIADLIAWGAIGARTTESQSHRQLASGLSSPIGFKNGTDGGVQIAADAIVAARASHAFMGMTKMGMAAIFETRGNDDAHVILRGGKKGPNYDSASIVDTCGVLKAAGLREQVMVDCSHANSGKSHIRQIEVAQDLARQLSQGEQRIIGVMIESNLEEGRQDLKPGVPLRYGVSITDACLAWSQTEPVLDLLASAVRERRKAVSGLSSSSWK
ncbi:3-deoxy-D-arabinoheptulosonate-7-phosphate synthase [Trinickia symbiotica]|uniref:Phospho-2-dehydro-3-deoxyheptonate aldolase n=1 Tax=Trinickia symbiotica TaxID=863227 RepID=A0A2N7X7F4_9BURK|nr:3-deoxy-7-phosphoheptulonate synthase [Trinickia symbiotica]PMS37385.1 3-deoxy-7-phosphoheptulonate synthase [Trinickia symbiotica]PPK42802.1 3-deoxy-D-arabinoheptulosonate-7-phosphate synthase [Trinickia symbiotica]